MRWSRISYTNKIYLARSIASGYKKYSQRLMKRDQDKKLIKEIEELSQKAVEIKAQQDELRAELKLKISELQKILRKLGEKVCKGKKLVKIEMEQPFWRAFGFSDKK